VQSIFQSHVYFPILYTTFQIIQNTTEAWNVKSMIWSRSVQCGSPSESFTGHDHAPLQFESSDILCFPEAHSEADPH